MLLWLLWLLLPLPQLGRLHEPVHQLLQPWGISQVQMGYLSNPYS